MSPKDRLIIALDVPTLDHAEKTVREIGQAGHFYKIGYQLFPIGGYDLARSLSAKGKKVFLDVKMFDIGATVERGVQSLVPIGADILTVHTDEDTIKGAVAGRGDDQRLKIFAVTVLTSWDHRAIQKHGLPHSVMDLVLFRAEMALDAGADGVIASAQEASAIKKQFGDALKIVTPGIRPAGSGADDQKRVVTPTDAINSGADALVVGRPIVKASDPKAAAKRILEEITATN